MIATVMGVSSGELVDARLEKLGWQIKLLAAQGRARVALVQVRESS